MERCSVGDFFVGVLRVLRVTSPQEGVVKEVGVVVVVQQQCVESVEFVKKTKTKTSQKDSKRTGVGQVKDLKDVFRQGKAKVESGVQVRKAKQLSSKF